VDTARYACFQRPGHRVTGDRSQRSRDWMADQTRVGYDFVHAIVDDHSRFAYVELHDDERAPTITAFVACALDWFSGHQIDAKRLMTDNAWGYVHNKSLREMLADRQIKHLRTQPYRPQTNGKVERFHQTMAREWAYGLAYRSHHHRNKACHTGSTTTTRAATQQDRQPATHQPRSQPTWTGHLDSGDQSYRRPVWSVMIAEQGRLFDQKVDEVLVEDRGGGAFG
jgi:transposase InsO family protein